MGVVDEIKSRIDIVDLIGNYVSLNKAGRNYKGLCPFHAEKTPSFVVFPDSQNWHCFGACGTGGDIFTFLMKQEGYDFQGALRELATRAGVPLSERSPAAAAADQQRQKLLDILAAAADYFHQLLLNAPQAAQTRDYVAGRGLNAEAVRSFQLGYALDQWEGLKRHLVGRGYNEADLLTVGLLVERDDGSSTYDRFRDRLVFPIRNERGQVIGFGARALHPNQVPKYLNSPQSALFDKSAVLYGLDLARKGIRDSGQAVIVEGYMDVIQAHQAGETNVVAQMGTALTEPQLKLLKRYTQNFVLALDSDTAGDAATLRGINVARTALDREIVPRPTARGLIRFEERLKADIRIATLPPGKDPDDLLREDLEAWRDIVTRAVPVVDFYFELLDRELDLTTARGKSAAVQEIIPMLREISDPVERESYVQKLARLVRIDERTLMAELESQPSKVARRRPAPPSAAGPALPPEPVAPDGQPLPGAALTTTGLEEHCLAMLIGHRTLAELTNTCLVEQKVAPLGPDDFQNSENRQIFSVVQAWLQADSSELETLKEMVGDALADRLDGLVVLWQKQPEGALEDMPRLLADAILRLRIRHLTRQAEELSFLLHDAQLSQDREAIRHYAALAQEKTIQRKILDHARNALSIMGQRRLEAGLLI